MPPILSLATRFLSDRLKGFGAWCGAAIWWFLEWAGDKVLGDAAFGWLRDMVSPLAQYPWLAMLWTYGIPLGLIGLGSFFFWRSGRIPPRTASNTADQTNTSSAPTPSTASRHPASPASAPPAQSAPSAEPPRKAEPRQRADALPVLSRPKPPPVAVVPQLPEVPDWEWGKLYSQSEEGGLIHLRFLPDTAESAKHTVLLIVYGYKALMGLDSVRVGTVHNEVRRVQRDAPNARGFHKIHGVYEAMFLLNDRDFGEDSIASGHLRRIKLSEGGAYELTPYGLNVARNTAWDLIERA